MKISSIEEALSSRKGGKAWIYAASALTGVFAGLVVVAYRLALSAIEGGRAAAVASINAGGGLNLVLWMGAAALAGLAVALMTGFAPLSKGSGIPQVKAALIRRARFNWIKELPVKFAGGTLAIGAGLSLGREGPSIHLGALVGEAVSGLAGRAPSSVVPRKESLSRYLVTAGSAAGIAAAFNAPLAGVLFCAEELHRSFSPTMLLASMLGSFSADAVTRLLLGSNPALNLGLGSTLPLEALWTVLPLGLACGLLGAAFNALLIKSQDGLEGLVPNTKARMAIAFGLAGLVAVLLPAITGGGHLLVEMSAKGGLAPLALAGLLAAKAAFTAFSYASGAPGGIFLPMLAIGALIGSIASSLLSGLGMAPGNQANFAVLGMAAFFAAVVRAPITGTVLIAEMSGSFAHFPSLILACLASTITAALLGAKPIYDELLERMGGGEAQAAQAGKAVLLHVIVHEGSVLDTCGDAIDGMPDGCVLVAIGRGEEEFLPARRMDLRPGDRLQVLAEGGRAARLKERLLELAAAGPGSAELP